MLSDVLSHDKFKAPNADSRRGLDVDHTIAAAREALAAATA